jgi:hypothetical protein
MRKGKDGEGKEREEVKPFCLFSLPLRVFYFVAFHRINGEGGRGRMRKDEEGKERKGKGREGKGREGKGREVWGRKGNGRKGKDRGRGRKG